MKLFFTSFFILLSFISRAQKVTYAKTINEDIDCNSYNVLGKAKDHYLIYKRVRWKHMLAVYDKQMKQVRNTRLAFIPDQAFKVDFIMHPHFVNVIYQYKQNGIIFCEAVRINELGKRLSEPVILDTSGEHVSGINIQYFVASSENRNKILVYKVMPTGDSFLLQTRLYEADLQLIDVQKEMLPTNGRTYFYSPFLVDDNGSYFTTRSYRANVLQKISRLDLLIKYNNKPGFSFVEIPVPEASFSQVKTVIDNLNKRYVLNSLFSKKGSLNVDGLFTTVVTADTSATITSAYNLFSDTLRKAINATQGLDAAFNNFVIRNITLKKDGGFRMTVEDCFELVYVSSLNVDFTKHLQNGYQHNFLDYFPLPKLYTEEIPEELYYFNNILAIDIDSSLEVKSNTVIYKSQHGGGGFESFGTFTSASETHFLFTGFNARQVIHNYALFADGGSETYAPFKTKAAGYTLMPKYLKQVGAKQVIIPGFYRGILSFALVDCSQTLQAEY